MRNWLARMGDTDIGYSFRHSPVAMAAALVAFTCLFCALFANVVAPHNPFDLATLELSDARLPPVWQEGGKTSYLLGTDDQGRDILSALMVGARISLLVGLASVLLSVALSAGRGGSSYKPVSLAEGGAGRRLPYFVSRLVRVDSASRLDGVAIIPPWPAGAGADAGGAVDLAAAAVLNVQ